MDWIIVYNEIVTNVTENNIVVTRRRVRVLRGREFDKRSVSSVVHHNRMVIELEWPITQTHFFVDTTARRIIS